MSPLTRSFLTPLFGALAAGALIIADLNPLAHIAEANMLLRLPQTSWGGNGRMWIAAGAMIVGTVLWALGAKRWPAFLAGACFGMLADIVVSGLVWRSEKFAMLKAIGLGDLEPTVRWQIGAAAYLAGAVFVLAFLWATAYPVRPPAARGSDSA